MSTWGSYSYLVAPLVAFALMGLFVVLLRWAFSRGHSVVASRPRRGRPDEYGLLVPVAAPETIVEAELLRRRLEAVGIAATLAPTTDGPRVLVFPRDEQVALATLRGRPAAD